MTNEEAIKVIQGMRLGLTATGAQHKVMEDAVEMACEALDPDNVAIPMVKLP